MNRLQELPHVHRRLRQAQLIKLPVRLHQFLRQRIAEHKAAVGKHGVEDDGTLGRASVGEAASLAR